MSQTRLNHLVLLHVHKDKTDSLKDKVIAKDLSEIEQKLNIDMENLNIWCAVNKIKINADKTKYMLIMTSQKRARMPNSRLNLKLNSTAIPYCDGDKVLGMHVNNSFDWSKHISNVCQSINY